jgi:hypothetical protein
MEITHTDACCNPPHYSGDEPCEPDVWVGFWTQPLDIYMDEAKRGDTVDVPWCRIRARAWQLQQAAGE